MRLVWTTSAKQDLGEIVTYIWYDSPSAAKRIRERVEKTTRYLRSQPYMGRVGELPDTREAFVPPSYRIVYRISDGTVSILRVLHTSRQWPPGPDAPADESS
ncbi:type II toxin-antitoxin system RelE/ParE family toxin [Mesorhizobium sp. J428]|uniref:type II toxin-antitoxin system RelE/ParE family toxin n=1 Tax=Mesorhizobium sp. J428 TaxID=2898440 RepID=UPI002151CBD7|nr:type II toxin-antitoxin system RelE/ParE family toxin [Mesorhizobium sp. J428]MCR5858227.1 type II toxin-antitoxin system RelE/ParE family toxin [Mesorhizobium sp. J428]